MSRPRAHIFFYGILGASLGVMPPSMLPGLGGIAIDARVMLFCLGLSLVSTLLIGLVPALRVSRAAFGEGLALHAGAARTTGDRQGERLRTLLVAGQIAMTLVLLIGAGLLIHSFVRLTSVSTGFESSGRDGVVQTVRVTLPQRYADEPERMRAFARGVLDRIQYLPGVTSASLINSMPFGRMFIQGNFEIEGQPTSTLNAGTPKIESGYFKTMRIPLLAGREFTSQDTAAALKVAIISERIARECRLRQGYGGQDFPGGPDEALGRLIRLGDRGEWLTVAQPRFRTLLVGLFATTATLIATCGLYGLMAYAVTQRRREIGVRMALGAERRDVHRLVLTRALRIVVAGLIVGLAGAVGVTRVLQRFLFGVTPTGPIVFTIVTLLLLAVGLMAAWLPARRASRIDAWAALRAE